MAERSISNRPSSRARARPRPGTTRPGPGKGPAFKYGFEQKAFYTPGEVAEVLRVSSQTVLDWIHQGRLDAVQLSERVYRIPFGGLLIHLGEPPRVTRVIGRYRRADDLEDARALEREHGIGPERR